MPDIRTKARRRWLAIYRRMRELRMIARGLSSTDHPVLAHLIPIRRCNLSCAYCNEFDDRSQPVAIGTLFDRVGQLAGLGANINVPLPAGSGTGAYSAAFERVVIPALRRCQPDLIIVASGLLHTPRQLADVIIGVLLLTIAGWCLNRAMGVPAPGLSEVTGLDRIPRTSANCAWAAMISSAFPVWNQAWATMAPGKPQRAFTSVSHCVSATCLVRSISASQCTVVRTLWALESLR